MGVETGVEGTAERHLLWLAWDTLRAGPCSSLAPTLAKHHGWLSHSLPEGTLVLTESPKVSVECMRRAMDTKLKKFYGRVKTNELIVYSWGSHFQSESLASP